MNDYFTIMESGAPFRGEDIIALQDKLKEILVLIEEKDARIVEAEGLLRAAIDPLHSPEDYSVIDRIRAFLGNE